MSNEWKPIHLAPNSDRLVEVAEEVDQDIWKVQVVYYDGSWPSAFPSRTYWRDWSPPQPAEH